MLNATYLFERRDSEKSVPTWPASRESFWTVVFSIFLLHLGQRDESQSELTVWHGNPSGKPKWYIKRNPEPTVGFSGLDFDDIAVEPLHIPGKNFRPKVNIPITLGGVSPDIFVRLKSNYLLIENKIGTTDLNSNQLETYPNLIMHLKDKNIQCQYILLISCGCTESQFRLANKKIQEQLGPRFGFLLWEHVILQMYETKFDIPGINIARWQKYTEALSHDAEI